MRFIKAILALLFVATGWWNMDEPTRSTQQTAPLKWGVQEYHFEDGKVIRKK